MQNMTTNSSFGCSDKKCRKKISPKNIHKGVKLLGDIPQKHFFLPTTVWLISTGFICAHRTHWSCQNSEVTVRNQEITHDAFLCGVSEKPTERDDRCEARKVQEEDGRHRLQCKRIFEIAGVPRQFPLHIVD